ncbi:MAG: hypothetical protein V8S72_05550 [Oscillospiraceae bacterium]
MHGCEEHLRETMALALPRGYIIPFAEFLTLHSGLIESVSQQEFPGAEQTHFTSVDALLEELDVLPQPPHRYPTPPPFSRTESTISPACWPPISPTRRRQRRGMSVGSVKNMASVIYAKLHIGSKAELKDYAL